MVTWFLFDSMMYDKDAGHTSFLEDVYECQSRYPAGAWGPASVPYTDVVHIHAHKLQFKSI